MYPAFLMALVIVVVIILTVFVLPTFAGVYTDFGGELPGLTKFMMGFSDVLIHWWWLIIIVIVFRLLSDVCYDRLDHQDDCHEYCPLVSQCDRVCHILYEDEDDRCADRRNEAHESCETLAVFLLIFVLFLVVLPVEASDQEDSRDDAGDDCHDQVEECPEGSL